jgi:hypothetical protein
MSEMPGDITVRRLVQRDRKDHGKCVDGDDLDEVQLHNACCAPGAR